MQNPELARAAEMLMVSVVANDAELGRTAASQIAQYLGGDYSFPQRVGPEMTTLYLLALLLRAYATQP